MHIALTDLKANIGFYVGLAETEEVIITKYGKPAAKIVRFDKESWCMRKIPDKVTSFEQLVGTLPPGIDLDDIRADRLTR